MGILSKLFSSPEPVVKSKPMPTAEQEANFKIHLQQISKAYSFAKDIDMNQFNTAGALLINSLKAGDVRFKAMLKALPKGQFEEGQIQVAVNEFSFACNIFILSRLPGYEQDILNIAAVFLYNVSHDKNFGLTYDNEIMDNILLYRERLDEQIKDLTSKSAATKAGQEFAKRISMDENSKMENMAALWFVDSIKSIDAAWRIYLYEKHQNKVV